MRPTPRSRTILLADRANPVTVPALVFGGIDRASGSVTASTGAGPGCRNASFKAPVSCLGFSTRAPYAAAARATAAKSGFLFVAP